MELDEVIIRRRDTRHFLPDPIDERVLEGLIKTANLAPSVGQSKPTRYIIVQDPVLRQKIKSNFLVQNEKAKILASGQDKDSDYAKLKLEGILEAPLGLVICCDLSVLKEFSIGTITQPREMLLASTSCAIHTLWLSLTQMGLGMGWVSILDFDELSSSLDLPAEWFPMGYFCIGKPATDYSSMPMLSLENWNSHLEPPIILYK